MEPRLNFLDVHVALCMWGGFIIAIVITSGQSNLTKTPHRSRTATVQWYSPGGASVHLT